MRKNCFLLCVTLLLLSLLLPILSLAQSDELFEYQALGLNFTLRNAFDIVPSSSSAFAEYVSAELSWYPLEDYRQQITLITTEPEANFVDEKGFLFEWENVDIGRFTINEQSSLTTRNDFVKVNKKIKFPLKDTDPSLSEFLAAQEIIDINDDIRHQASELAANQDDLYQVVFNIAEWVSENVEYDMTTVTAEATQKASWVFDNRKGVCDEITSLFISMCRSLGIPARFVSGVSYSNINQQNDGWGPHGWAEVYFPGTGWVPFDVTYNEFGFIDSAHIKLKISPDAKETSIDYSSRGRDIEIKPGEMEFFVDVTSSGQKISPAIILEAEPAEQEVGFGSANLLILNVKNPNDYYVTTRLSLANVNGLEIKESNDNKDNYNNNNVHSLILAPKEEGKTYWMVRVSSELDQGYIYTFPLKVSGSRAEKAETLFKAKRDGKIFSEEYMRMLMIAEQPYEKPYSQNVILSCSASKSKIFVNESIIVNCLVDNKGDKALNQLNICLGDDCSTRRISAKEAARFEFSKSFETLGVKTLVFKAENELVDKSYYLIVDVQDKPLVEISNLTYPESISYKNTSELKFFVKKKSNTNPLNVRIKLEHDLLEQEWSVPNLNQDYQFTVILRGDNLKLNKNDFKIIVSYTDEQGNPYSAEEEFSINLVDTNIFQKLLVWVNILGNNIEGWFE